MSDLDIQRVRDFMTRYAHVADNATDLAEMAGCELGLDAELNDPASELWDLALAYVGNAEPD